MNKKEKTGLIATAISLFMAILLVTLGFMFVKLRDTQKRLTELERGTSARITEQQEQLDSIQVNVEGLNSSTDALMQDVEKLGKDLRESRQVQSNTIGALNRLRKQKDELEKKLEEGLELRRQRLAEMQARWSAPSEGWTDIGGFLLTAYEWTGKTCANGNYPTVGYTCASNYYPLGTRLWIEGIGERVVEDTGDMGMNVVDIYMGDEETCIQFGVQEAQITVIEE